MNIRESAHSVIQIDDFQSPIVYPSKGKALTGRLQETGNLIPIRLSNESTDDSVVQPAAAWVLKDINETKMKTRTRRARIS